MGRAEEEGRLDLWRDVPAGLPIWNSCSKATVAPDPGRSPSPLAPGGVTTSPSKASALTLGRCERLRSSSRRRSSWLKKPCFEGGVPRRRRRDQTPARRAPRCRRVRTSPDRSCRDRRPRPDRLRLRCRVEAWSEYSRNDDAVRPSTRACRNLSASVPACGPSGADPRPVQRAVPADEMPTAVPAPRVAPAPGLLDPSAGRGRRRVHGRGRRAGCAASAPSNALTAASTGSSGGRLRASWLDS